jgi:hypothetical protein
MVRFADPDRRSGNQRRPAAESDNGLERFTTSTRRQNFLIPPRCHRAFPAEPGSRG